VARRRGGFGGGAGTAAGRGAVVLAMRFFNLASGFGGGRFAMAAFWSAKVNGC
jgi:hypothetical protein